jgi:hypothetical protein
MKHIQDCVETSLPALLYGLPSDYSTIYLHSYPAAPELDNGINAPITTTAFHPANSA